MVQGGSDGAANSDDQFQIPLALPQQVLEQKAMKDREYEDELSNFSQIQSEVNDLEQNPIARYAASHQMLNQELMASGEILSSLNNTGEIQLPFRQ